MCELQANSRPGDSDYIRDVTENILAETSGLRYSTNPGAWGRRAHQESFSSPTPSRPREKPGTGAEGVAPEYLFLVDGLLSRLWHPRVGQ